MAKTANKTQPTPIAPADTIAAIADPIQRADAVAIDAMMARVSGEPATMWGPSIIGYGRYHYRYDSGREGDACRIGFSPRKGQTVLYLAEGYEAKEALLTRLGKHKIGKACLYIKRLSDVDVAVLEEMIAASLAHIDLKYPKG